MLETRWRRCAFMLAATALTVPAVAHAAGSTSREAELEARLLRLESEMEAMKADLAQARADKADAGIHAAHLGAQIRCSLAAEERLGPTPLYRGRHRTPAPDQRPC